MTTRNSSNEMKNPNQIINGYPSLAAFIASDKDDSASIYRSHRRISSRNLLYLEVELSELESQLDYFDERDLSGSFEDKKVARSWKALRESDSEEHKERVRLIYKIRQKSKEFHEALILEEAVAKLGRPHHSTVQALDNWTRRLGPSILTDQGAERLRNEDDLIVLRVPPDQDWLIRFVRRYLRIFFLEEGYRGGVAYISETKIIRAANLFSMFTTAMLLVLAIVNLYLVHKPATRLGLIGGYTAVFALSLGILTNARRAELYGSTAAYAAVLVVFVSGDLASPKNP